MINTKLWILEGKLCNFEVLKECTHNSLELYYQYVINGVNPTTRKLNLANGLQTEGDGWIVYYGSRYVQPSTSHDMVMAMDGT